MRNYLIFAGRDSRDFGVYISGQGTFSAPSRAYSFNPIAGRNGALIGNERRLENIEVSYECFIYADFDKNIGDFRSFLLSCIGYQELSDSYHPDEFRLACYTGPFEPTVTKRNDAGNFTLTFNCKPQRYLQSGRNSYSWYANGGQTVRGKSITVEDVSKLNRSVLKSFVRNTGIDGSISTGIRINGNPESVGMGGLRRGRIGEAEVDWIAGTAQETVENIGIHSNESNFEMWARESSTSFSYDRGLRLQHTSIEAVTKYNQYDLVFAGDPTFDTSSQKLYFTTKAEYESLESFLETLKAIFGYKEYVYTSPETAIVAVSLRLQTPYTKTFEPLSLPTVGSATFILNELGETADGYVEVEYLTSSQMANPTLFPSEPLIRVTGTGSFEMDGVTVTVTDCDEYVDIDCELMDCYEGTTNRNADVMFSTYDFPKLQPGENDITILDGITHIEIWPRWWRL